MSRQDCLDVVALVLLEQDRVLMAQRPGGDPLAGLWEFPGGKVETGENREEALTREILEELGLEVMIGDYLLTVEQVTPVPLRLHAYFGRRQGGEPKSKVHAAVEWVKLDELDQRPMPEADIPIAQALLGRSLFQSTRI